MDPSSSAAAAPSSRVRARTRSPRVSRPPALCRPAAREGPRALAGSLGAPLSDSALAGAGARAGAPAFGLTAPPALRAFAVAALAADPARGGAGRTVFAVTATTREGEDLLAALGD